MTIEVHESLPETPIQDAVAWTFRHLEIGAFLPLIRVRVLRTDHWHHLGHFYAEGRTLQGVLLIARVPLKLEYGHDRGFRGGPPPIDPYTPEEAVVCVVSHELTHLLQWLVGPKTKGYIRELGNGEWINVRGRTFSEVEAEWAEYRALHAWRRKE